MAKRTELSGSGSTFVTSGGYRNPSGVMAVAEIFQRSYVLLTGPFLATLTPVIQQDWKGPFRTPLF